ncbi:MAG TPA: M14 family metallocarboxypeptidase [Xanthomonadales bacterium]|nr:M14 family metallocarboxypeptidase [Xanthomonadales bacterium]
MNDSVYPIGTPGQPWGDSEKAEWLSRQSIRRSYREEVLDKLETLHEHFDFEQYGALSFDPARYPLFIARTRNWDSNKPVALVTGGVHGYETSGVQGAIRFLATRAREFEGHFNLLVAPCVSPWGYETINRWNPQAVDPNRSFKPGSDSEEAQFLISHIAKIKALFHVHIDLHETTDTDDSEFRPALAARDGKEFEVWGIPDGFYLVGDSAKPKASFQEAMIKSVEQITHIAPADKDNKIIGETVEQWGVINYDAKPLGLCMATTEAPYVTTTEVYPDSPEVSAEDCILAQVAAVCGGLQHVISGSTDPC